MGTTGQSITLANSIIGVGILAMPFCFQQCGVLLAVLMLLLSGLVSRLSCYFLLKSAIIARKGNFEFLAFHVFGASGKLMVEIAIIGFLMGTCTAYFVVVGDLGPQIIANLFNINQSSVLRTCIMLVVSLVCVLPLGLLRNVDSLGNVSAATIGFYFCLIMKVMAEATTRLFTTDWWSNIELWKPEGVLQCLPIFSMALFCQTQLFEIFETMPMLSLEKMSVVTKNALHVCTAVYLMVGVFGYIAFGGHRISGNILSCLSPTLTSDVIKLGFVLSLAFSFPLIIFPCRASLYSLMYRKALSSHHDHIINRSIPETTFRCITVCVVGATLFVSLLVPNIELVLGLVGSTIGVMVCVIFPAACFMNVIFKDTNERLLAKIILCLGFVIMILGTYANLEAADSSVHPYDEKHITQDQINQIVQDFMENNHRGDSEIVSPVKAIPQPQIDKLIEDKNSAVQPPIPLEPDIEKHESALMKQDNSHEIITKSNIKVPENEVEGAGDKDIVNNAQLEKESEIFNKPILEAKDIDAIKREKETAMEEEKLLQQKNLIETIKQHGEEQKELIKEQQEILHEIKKTQEELDMKKKEKLKEEANKIAVESIQKIASIAIQSLSAADGNEINQHALVDKPEQKSAEAAEVLQKAVENIEKIVHNVSPNAELKKIDDTKSKQDNSAHIEIKQNKIDTIEETKQDIIIKTPLLQPDKIQVGEEIRLKEKMEEIQKISPKMEALLNKIPVPFVMNQKYEVKSSEQKQASNILSKKENNLKANDVVLDAREKEHPRDKRDTDCIDCIKDKLQSMPDSNIDIKFPHKLSDPDGIELKSLDLSEKYRMDALHKIRSLKSVKESDSDSR